MPNSHFWFSELEFTLILWHFAEAAGASRFPYMKKWVKAKSIRPGSTTTLLLCKMSKFQLLIFGPRPTIHDLCSPQGTSHEESTAHLGRGPLYGKSQNSKNYVAGPASPAFWATFHRLLVKNQNSGLQIFFASSSAFQKGMTQPPHFKTLGGDRFGRKPFFWGPGLTPLALGSDSPTRKLLAISLGAVENLGPISHPFQKLKHFFKGTAKGTEGQTQRQTFPNDPCATWEIFFAQTVQNFYHFTTRSLARFACLLYFVKDQETA